MIAKGGNRKAEGGNQFPRSRCAHNFPLPPSPLRHGLTLIELLITITIIATLSAMFLGASRVAMEQSRASRTKTTISKLHTLLMQQWNSYETRRIDLNGYALGQLNGLGMSNIDQVKSKSTATRQYQLQAKREMMKLEMPDRWSDITGTGFGGTPLYPTNPPNHYPTYLADRPTLAKIYLRRYLTADPSERFQGAECLYMIIMYACGDGEARTMFAAQDIGDVDEDGAPEFLDGWGRPIHFVRWPAGFISPLQSVLAPNGLQDVLREGDPDQDHDPDDPFGVDPMAYRLVPLIFSAGADGETLYLPEDGGVQYPDDQPRLNLNPYAQIYGNEENSDLVKLATTGGPSRTETGHLDDIHNHLQEAR